MKTKLIILSMALVGLISSCKYEDGPMLSLRSKKNRVAHKIGKHWKSDDYSLQFGQHGFALKKLGIDGAIDIGNWSFNDTKTEIEFDSEMFKDYDFYVTKLQHRHLWIEGIFPYDKELKLHKFKLEETVDELEP